MTTQKITSLIKGVLTSLLIVTVVAGEICFKKYNPLKQGCHKELRHKQLASPDECCALGGQGYALQYKHVGHKRKWYECTPCPQLADKTNMFNPLPSEYLNEAKPNVISSEQNDEDSKLKERLKNKTDFQKVTEEPSTPVTSVWTEWSDWGPCSGSCGQGHQRRGRFCLSGKCEGDDLEEKKCFHLMPCPIDGGWGLWHDWEPCSVTCGSGTQTRIRKCDNPQPAYGGKVCEGLSEQSQHCVMDPCSIHGGWSDWSEWSACNVTCGVGYQERLRRCDNPEPQYGGGQCEGDWVEVRTCKAEQLCTVDGGWSDWSEWSTCNVTCGEGHQERSRHCDSPLPQHGGAPCQGHEQEVRNCSALDDLCSNATLKEGTNNDSSRVDGQWCEWSDWSPCLINSIQTAFRACECPRPLNGGLKCKGRIVKKRPCMKDSQEDSPDLEDDEDVYSGDKRVRSGCEEGSGDGSDVNCDQEPDDQEDSRESEERESDESSGSHAFKTWESFYSESPGFVEDMDY